MAHFVVTYYSHQKYFVREVLRARECKIENILFPSNSFLPSALVNIKNFFLENIDNPWLSNDV